MKRIKLYTTALLLFLLGTSCGDWLNVLPKSEIDEENMFEDADGYYTALNGVYINMSDEKLYGDYLLLSLIEPLSQQYELSNDEPERKKWMAFDYTGSDGQKSLLDVWSKMYNNIVNCNLLIQYLQQEERVLFEKGVSDILLAEALALRAYMYFDLVRMFNESPPKNRESNNVPFKTDFGLMIGDKLSTTELLGKLMADLKESRAQLLVNDPIVTGQRYKDKYVAYDRKQRMNYYAVTALMARIALYTEDYRSAYEYATAVISCDKFRFIQADEIIRTDTYGNETKIDRLFIPELIFGLYTENILSASRKTYEPLNMDAIKSKTCYQASDLRLTAWLFTNQLNRINLIRYKRSSADKDKDKYDAPLAPMLRLSEMYLIAGEAALKEPATGGDAAGLINTLKSNRLTSSLPANSNREEIWQEITREYICEFKGEGQLFWFYKRNNMDKIDNGNNRGTMLSVNPEAYTFPLPQYEIDFGK